MNTFSVWHHTYLGSNRSGGTAGFTGESCKSRQEAEKEMAKMQKQFEEEAEQGLVSPVLHMDLYIVSPGQHECELPGHSGGCRQCVSGQDDSAIADTDKVLALDRTGQETARKKALLQIADDICRRLGEYRTLSTGEAMALELIEAIWGFLWISSDPSQLSMWLRMAPRSYLARRHRSYQPMLRDLSIILHETLLGRTRDGKELRYVMGWVKRFAANGWYPYRPETPRSVSRRPEVASP